jgi:hypothetical protein
MSDWRSGRFAASPRNLYRAQEGRRELISSTNENSGRHAVSFGGFETTGWGEIPNPDAFAFGATYIKMPAVSYGYALDDEAIIDTRFPRCWGGVMGWERDENDFYVGAHVFVVVETQSAFIAVSEEEENDPNYTISHFFTFNGIALKYVVDDFNSFNAE